MSNEQANDSKIKKTMSKTKKLIIIISTIIVLIAGITFGYFMNVKVKLIHGQIKYILGYKLMV